MREVFDGFPASRGIGSGSAHVLKWGVPEVRHEMVAAEDVPGEVARFHDAREWAARRIRELQSATGERLGPMEARIFDPQILMLEDPEIVDGTVRYIEENHLRAERAFEWRILELQALWTRTANPLVLDKLSDLEDLQVRVLHRLLGLPDPSDIGCVDEGVVIVASNLTPSVTAQLDPERVVGIAADHGTRQSHWVILARSLEIPAVAGLGNVSTRVREGQEVILDGRVGRVVIDPDERDRTLSRQRKTELIRWREELESVSDLEAVTADGQPVALRANIDIPAEAARARELGAVGVGLVRTEFLVVGRSAMPDEEEQYRAYRHVAEAFPHHQVVIRTFDLGGDKFPIFLHMPAEENPFLGWRAIRVCLDSPELFRTQLRAILRATVHGDVRIMLPLINEADEILRVRELIEEEETRLRAAGVDFNSGYKLGILVETPGAALHAAELARYCDFFSIGTNDLVQYTLAVDRTSHRLAERYKPFHPAVLRQIDHIAREARAAGVEVSVCGELAATPLGAFLFLGLDIHALSVAWPALPELKTVIRSVRVADAREAARTALEAPSPEEVARCLQEGIGTSIDLELFSGRWVGS